MLHPLMHLGGIRFALYNLQRKYLWGSSLQSCTDKISGEVPCGLGMRGTKSMGEEYAGHSGDSRFLQRLGI